MKTFRDLITALENGTLVMPKNNFFRSTELLIEEIKEEVDNFDEGLDTQIEALRDDDGKLWRFKKITWREKREDDDERGFGDTFKMHDFISGFDLNLEVLDGKVRPFYRDYTKGEEYHPGWFRGENIYDIPDSAYEPTINEVVAPSRSLTFVNYFIEGENKPALPKDVEYGKEHSLNSYMGRMNLAKYMAKEGFGYGQTGNMGIDIYSNGKTILIVDGSLDVYLCNLSWVKKHSENLEEEAETIREGEEAEKLIQYLEDNNFKKIGEISCEVWRWECCDTERANKIIAENPDANSYKYNEPIHVPIDGDKAKITHWFYTKSHGQCPISSHVMSMIEVVQ